MTDFEQSCDAPRLLAGRGIRAFADGLVSVALPVYLLRLGYGLLAIAAIITSTLIGSALATLAVGFGAHRFHPRTVLLAAAVLMTATGAGFALIHAFWALMLIAFFGTMNPSAGDVSLFLPVEQAMLAAAAPGHARTHLFARYSLVGAILGAGGTLTAALPDFAAHVLGIAPGAAMNGVFWFYAASGAVTFLLYRRLSTSETQHGTTDAPLKALGKSKPLVYGLAALFSLDAFGGGFFVQSLLTLWLFEAWKLSVATASAILFWSGLFSAGSYLVAVPLAGRFGLVNTMVFTHLPSNILLMMVPFAPTLWIAVALLLARSALSQMDVPTRTSYVMAVVAPEERPAAASLTSVPRSLASAVSPLLAGYLLTLSSFGWPLLAGGALKALYDLLLLAKFRKHRPEHETAGTP